MLNIFCDISECPERFVVQEISSRVVTRHQPAKIDSNSENLLEPHSIGKDTPADPSQRARDHKINTAKLFQLHLSYEHVHSPSVTSSLMSTAGGTCLSGFEERKHRIGGRRDNPSERDVVVDEGCRRNVKFDSGDQDIELLGVGAQFGDIGYSLKHAGP
ncbi:hypothetical protein ONS95_004300 [Cadophora gregata]|uniref:uncharacterized protein n=1 Tax=Cadophora gregata TaxID=51156 RepID=UPI0026DAEC03|nr:uncharacterized protein ONS95_004300 [Cadophora gregata]KAK0105782.1 hypothetical protein ONS95_004300 [Cadophora gregata]